MGIVSFGFEGICGNGRPAIYTRLASYLEWIQASLEP
jgi:secreted trypsin-like serine protease